VRSSVYMTTATNRKSPTAAAHRRYVNERELSEITGRSTRTLQKDRLLGTGPFPFYRLGRQILYDVDECLRIIESTRVGSGGAAA
jgi:hypothetical protein